jgi:hypothetical protein
MSRQLRANLRSCTCCLWVYKRDEQWGDGCPQCGKGSVSAYSVHGRNGYHYHITQKPWLDAQLASAKRQLHYTIVAYQLKHGLIEDDNV